MHAGRDIDKMLGIVRKWIDKCLRDKQGLGFIPSEQVANTVTGAQVVEWLKRRLQKRNKAAEDRKTAIRDADEQSCKKEDVIADAVTQTRQSCRNPEEGTIAKGRDHDG